LRCQDGNNNFGFAVPDDPNFKTGKFVIYPSPNGPINGNCSDRADIHVPFIDDSSKSGTNGDIGFARFTNGRPIAYLNGPLVEKHKTEIGPYCKSFIMGHECGHHALGHARCYEYYSVFPKSNPRDIDLDADFFAFLRNRDGPPKWSVDTMYKALDYISKYYNKLGDGSHYPSDVRVQKIKSFLGIR